MKAPASQGGGRVKVDTTKLDAISQALAALGNVGVEVGYFDASPIDGGANLPTVAVLNEYGTKTSAARPFLRNAVAAAEPDLAAIARDGVRDLVERGSKPEDVARKLGIALVRSIHRQLDTAASWAAANKAGTIRSKRGSVPLYAGHGSLRKGVEIALTQGGRRGRTEKPTNGE